MYKIFLRGLDDIELPDDIGVVVAEQYDAGTLPTVLKISDDLSFESKLVKGYKRLAQIHTEDTKKANSEHISQVNSDYNRHMLACANWPIEKRAEYMRFAEMIWFAHTGDKTIPDAVRAEIALEQLKYLKDNPSTVFAHPKCLRGIVAPYTVRVAAGKDFKIMEVAIRERMMEHAFSIYSETLAYKVVENK